MAYRWSLEGPAFEFPTPYGTENRYLVWRGCALIALALLIVLVVSFVGGGKSDADDILLGQVRGKGSVVPHLVAAMLLTVLGALDLLQAAARRTLLLAPGQPASLVPEVAREASGASPSAATLQRLLEVGATVTTEPVGPYAAWLHALAPQLGAAPAALHAHLRHRLAHAVLATCLAALLLLAAGVARQPLVLALVSMTIMAVCSLVLVRHLLLPWQGAMPPWVVGALVALAVAAAGAAYGFADQLPRSAVMSRLGLPLAAAVLLASVVLFEVCGILAAREQVHVPWLAAIPPEVTSVAFDAEPEQLLREVDLELHRQWNEGVPNRRYAWHTPQLVHGALEGEYQATVLEESQPLVPRVGRDRAPSEAQNPGSGLPLLWLDGLGLAWSLAGGVLWLWLAQAHMRDASASWVPGAVGFACLLAGAYAVRVGHLLWSRVEVQSSLTWLDFKGRYQRLTQPVAEDAPRGRGEPLVRVAPLQLHARVALVHSVFYAAAPHAPGSRVLLGLTADRGVAGNWLQMVQGYARQVSPELAEAHAGAAAQAAPAAVPRPRARVGTRPPGPREAEAPVPRRQAKFCPQCGTPVLAAARFCQHCGTALNAD